MVCHHCNETSLVVPFVLQNDMGIFSTSDVEKKGWQELAFHNLSAGGLTRWKVGWP